MTRRVLVDTDMALDDWMALAFLCATPAAELCAVTIAATGEAHAGPGVKNALRLCALGDAPVDVAAGRTTPLAGARAFPWFVRLVMDLRLGISFPRARRGPAAPRAVAGGAAGGAAAGAAGGAEGAAVEVLRRHLARGPATIIAIGPLTNIAELVTKHPEVKGNIEGVFSMGGALDVGGNLHEMIKTDNKHAEWNIYIDPRAANVVFGSGVPVTLVPLDATNQLPMTDDFYARLAREAASPAGQLVFRVVKRIKPLMKPSTPFCFWDPLTTTIALHPEIATFAERRVTVDESDGPESGRVKDDANGAPIRVCTKIDRAAFEQRFIDGLNGRA